MRGCIGAFLPASDRIEPFELNVVDRLSTPCHWVAPFNPFGADPMAAAEITQGRRLIQHRPSEYARALRCCRALHIGQHRCPCGPCFNARIFAPGLGTIHSGIGPSDQLLVGMPIGRIHHTTHADCETDPVPVDE